MGVREIAEQMNKQALAKQALAKQAKAVGAVGSIAQGQGNGEDGNNLSTVQPVAQPSPVLPIRTDPDEIIFKCARSVMNFFIQDKRRISFENGYLCTKDPMIISTIRMQYLHSGLVTVVEKGPLKESKVEQVEDKKE